MEVLLNQGLYRHLKFNNGGSSTHHFNITTWPGYLCISGDMGSFVFYRLPDMFQFFRGEKINPDYWSQKLTAVDDQEGYEKFSREAFRGLVLEHIEECFEFPGDAEKAETIEEVQDNIFPMLTDFNDGGWQAINSLMEFESPYGDFQDSWEWDFKEYTYRFIWCLWAVVWGIQQFDASHSTAPVKGDEA